jgi:hypothetical protein
VAEITPRRIRTVQRGYATSTKRSSRVTRVHVVREDGKHAGRQTMCGQHAYDVTNSEAIIRNTPHPLPGGLTWCPKCIGHAAEHLGRLDEVARLLGVDAPPSPRADWGDFT